MAKEWIKSVVSLDDSLNGGFMLIGDWVPFKYMDKIILNDIENGVYFIFNITQNNVIIHTCKDGKCLQHSSDSFTKFEYDSGNWILKYIDTIDTSSPVMATINNTMLTESGLESKPKGKIIDHLYIEYSDIDHELLNHNLKMFRKILC